MKYRAISTMASLLLAGSVGVANASESTLNASLPKILGAVNATSYITLKDGEMADVVGAVAIPLQLYWNPQRQDNVTVATPEGQRDSWNAQYRFIRVEGYVLR